jgi:hypothetical protein
MNKALPCLISAVLEREEIISQIISQKKRAFPP